MRNLAEIEEIINKLARQINASASALPTYNNSRRDGTPDIEIGGSLYYYRAFDRDTVSLNRQTDNMARLLYWVFVDITSTMASDYVREHRDPQIDSRKARFEYQLMLLGQINHEWKELRKKEIEEILKDSPSKEMS